MFLSNKFSKNSFFNLNEEKEDRISTNRKENRVEFRSNEKNIENDSFSSISKIFKSILNTMILRKTWTIKERRKSRRDDDQQPFLVRYRAVPLVTLFDLKRNKVKSAE